jgi:hypothetical protein
MARLLADDAFPRPVMFELRSLGHDVAGLEETGRLSHWSRDEEILAVARETGRALLTLDHRSFTRPGLLHPPHPGIIICVFDPHFIGLASRIHGILSTGAKLDGQIVRVGRRRTVSA